MPPRKKRSGRKGARKTTGAGGRAWGSLLAGFAAGVLVTLLGMFVYATSHDISFGAGIRNLLDNRSTPRQTVPEPQPRDTSSPRPVFDFYTVLPEYETVIDEKQYQREASKAPARKEPDIAYVLQAASYSSFKDADKLKAKLALNGLSSKIEKVTVTGKGDFFRVRLGPYSNPATMRDVDKRLRSLGIKPMHLKVRAGAG